MVSNSILFKSQNTRGPLSSKKPEKSALREHFTTIDHRIDWNRIAILLIEEDYVTGLSEKSWLINENLRAMNINNGKTLHSVYTN